MDDARCRWTPERRADGSVEICVNHNDTPSGRLSFDSVSLPRYIKLYHLRALDFQVRGQERPQDTRPTPEEVQLVLDGEIPVKSAPLSRENRSYAQLRAAVLNTVSGTSVREPGLKGAEKTIEPPAPIPDRLALIRQAVKKVQKKSPLKPQPAAKPERAAPQQAEISMSTTATRPSEGDGLAEYRRAIALLRSNAQEPTPAAIAGLLSVSVDTVQEVLGVHPELVAEAKGEDSAPSDKSEETEAASSGSTTSPTRARYPTAEELRARFANAPRGEHNAYLKNFPPVEETAKKFAALSEGDRGVLKSWASKGWDKEGQAQELGLSSFKLANKLSGLLADALGVPNQTKRKRYVGRVIAEYEKRKDKYDAMAAPPPVEEPVVEEPATPAPPPNGHAELAAPAAVPIPVPQGGQIPVLSPEHPSLMQGAATHGMVMVHLPPGTREITIKFS